MALIGLFLLSFRHEGYCDEETGRDGREERCESSLALSLYSYGVLCFGVLRVCVCVVLPSASRVLTVSSFLLSSSRPSPTLFPCLLRTSSPLLPTMKLGSLMTLNGTVYLRDFNPFVELKVSADITIDGQPGKIRCRGALAVSNKGINGDSGGGGSVWKFTVSESDPYTFRIGVTHQGIHITQAVAELTLDPARNAINGSFGGVAVLDTVELALKMDIDEEEEADGSFVGKGIRLELDVSNDGTCLLV